MQRKEAAFQKQIEE
jgi:hypothetical protein